MTLTTMVLLIMAAFVVIMGVRIMFGGRRSGPTSWTRPPESSMPMPGGFVCWCVHAAETDTSGRVPGLAPAPAQ